MEFVFYTVIFLVVIAAVAGFVQTIIYPPVLISNEELPAVVAAELKTYFADFQPREIKQQKIRHRYLLAGMRDGHQCQMTINLTPDGELAEVEFEQVRSIATFTNKTPISSGSVPAEIGARVSSYLASDLDAAMSIKAYSGMIGSENGFQIEIRSEDYEFEFEFTANGKLLKFEKKHLGY